MNLSQALSEAKTGRQLWRGRVEHSPDAVFLRHEGHDWTYASFDELKARYATGLAKLGVGPGSRVLVGMATGPRAMAIHFALMRLGAVVVPLQNDLAFEELRHQIDHSAAAVLVVDGAAARTVLTHLAELTRIRHVITDITDITDIADSHAGAVPFAELEACAPRPFEVIDGHDSKSLALILYTSGSTGKAKGVMLSAGSFVTAGFGFAEKFGITAGDNYFLPLTMGHAIGALVAPAIAVATGGVLTLADRFSPSTFWQQVRESGATCSILFPAHLNLLLNAAQASGDTRDGGNTRASGDTPLRLIITHAWDERFATRFGVDLATVWGMTETGAMATGSTPGAARGARAGYVGTPMTGVEIGVFGPDDSRLPPGQVGEIRLRHEHVMLGYLNDPEQTSRMLVDGWVCSGDEGIVEADGSVYFLGRKRHMIKRSGENISPDEVAEALLAHPAVIEALVFGVADDVRTEEVAAVVVVERDAQPQDILAVAGGRIVVRKLPRYLKVTTMALPRLGNGKIDRTSVVEGFALESVWDRSRLDW